MLRIVCTSIQTIDKIMLKPVDWVAHFLSRITETMWRHSTNRNYQTLIKKLILRVQCNGTWKKNDCQQTVKL